MKWLYSVGLTEATRDSDTEKNKGEANKVI
jgi:hypothetical protein